MNRKQRRNAAKKLKAASAAKSSALRKGPPWFSFRGVVKSLETPKAEGKIVWDESLDEFHARCQAIIDALPEDHPDKKRDPRTLDIDGDVIGDQFVVPKTHRESEVALVTSAVGYPDVKHTKITNDVLEYNPPKVVRELLDTYNNPAVHKLLKENLDKIALNHGLQVATSLTTPLFKEGSHEELTAACRNTPDFNPIVLEDADIFHQKQALAIKNLQELMNPIFEVTLDGILYQYREMNHGEVIRLHRGEPLADGWLPVVVNDVVTTKVHRVKR